MGSAERPEPPASNAGESHAGAANPNAATYRCVPCKAAGRPGRGVHRRVIRDPETVDRVNAAYGTNIRAGSAVALCGEHWQDPALR